MQGQKVNPENALQEIQILTKAGKIDEVAAYFSKHGTLYPDGISSGSREMPSLYLGSENTLMTFDSVKRKFNDQNQMLNQLKLQCSKQADGVQKLRCLTSGNQPCSSNRDVGCTVKEIKNNGSGTGEYSLSSISSVAEYVPFITAENLDWYIEAVETSAELTNKNRETAVATQAVDMQKSALESAQTEKKWNQFCKSKNIKAIFKAHVEPINKFDGSGVFSFVSVGVQHCIGDSFKDRFQYLNFCPSNRNRTCGVIYGLPKNIQPNQMLPNLYLAYTGTVKGSTEDNLKEEKLAGLRVLSEAELTKAGLN